MERSHTPMHDPETGVVSRPYFEKAFECEWKLAARDLTPLAVSLIQVESPGAASRALDATVGRLAVLHFSGSGMVVSEQGPGRFVALMPRTHLLAARRLAEEFAALVGRRAGTAALPLSTSRVNVCQGVTAALAPSDFAEGAAGFRRQAESALLAARRGGPGRVIVETGANVFGIAAA